MEIKQTQARKKVDIVHIIVRRKTASITIDIRKVANKNKNKNDFFSLN